MSWGSAQRVHTSSHSTGPDATREGRRHGACEVGLRRPTLLLPTQTHAHALPLACRTPSSGTLGPQIHQHRAPCMCLSPPPNLDAPHGIPHASVRCHGMGEGISSLSYPCFKSGFMNDIIQGVAVQKSFHWRFPPSHRIVVSPHPAEHRPHIYVYTMQEQNEQEAQQ